MKKASQMKKADITPVDALYIALPEFGIRSQRDDEEAPPLLTDKPEGQTGGATSIAAKIPAVDACSLKALKDHLSMRVVSDTRA